MKKWIVILGLVVAGSAGAWAWHLAHQGPEAAPPVKTAKIARGGIESHVEATGSVECNLDVDLKSKASGEVVLLPYDVSARVPKYVPGQNEANALLVALDPTDEKRVVERAQAARDAAQATLNQAKAAMAIAAESVRVGWLEANAEIESAAAKLIYDEKTLERHTSLATAEAVSQKDRDSAEAAARVSRAQLRLAIAKLEAQKGRQLAVEQRQAEVDLAAAQLGAAEADLADAKQRLADTKIYSPIDGVVTARNIQVGTIIASGIQNIGGGTTLLTVSDLSRIFVLADVHESDIGRLVETGRLDQEADITADAYPGRHFRGKVVQITPRGVSEAKVITFTVKVEVLGEGTDLLLPKMTADVNILSDSRKGALLVPNNCLHYEKDRPYVEVKAGADFQRRWVKLGIADGQQSEVLDGLKEGDEVSVGTGITSRWMKSATAPAEPAQGGMR